MGVTKIMSKENELLLAQSTNGNVYTTPEVIRFISQLASKEVEGVGDLTSKLVDLFASKSKHVSVEAHEDLLRVEVSISVFHGYKAIDVARKVQFAISEALKINFELEDVHVDVVIKELLLAPSFGEE